MEFSLVEKDVLRHYVLRYIIIIKALYISMGLCFYTLTYSSVYLWSHRATQLRRVVYSQLWHIRRAQTLVISLICLVLI